MPDPTPLNPPRRRLEALDILRGLLMLLMAIDHVRDFYSGVHIDPTNPEQSWPALYATRWVTHLCAPGFIALAGASVYLQRQRGKTPQQMMRFLLTRGLWLIFLEITLISFGWSFSLFIGLQVIWAIGVAMIVLAFLQWLPTAAVGSIGAAILVLHNLLDTVPVPSHGISRDLFMLLHQGGLLTYHSHPLAFELYPLLSWIGVILVGYSFGALAGSTAAPAVRHRRTFALAALFFAVFSALRLTHAYGDVFPFQHLGSFSHSAMSFFEVQKYPPSLHYVLATFSVLLVLYTLFDIAVSHDWAPRFRGVIETFGRVPFFYYMLHIYLIHGSALLITMARGGDWHYYTGVGPLVGAPTPFGGYSLPMIYLIWATICFLLYWPCLWFSGLRARRSDWWLSYL